MSGELIHNESAYIISKGVVQQVPSFADKMLSSETLLGGVVFLLIIVGLWLWFRKG